MDESLLRKFHKALSAGTVSLALLAVVAAAGAEAMYGYQIAKRLEAAGEGVLVGDEQAVAPSRNAAPRITDRAGRITAVTSRHRE